MKFNISPPPISSENPKEHFEQIVSWLYMLAEELNIVLNCLSEENFCEEEKNLIRQFKERGNNNSDIQN